MAGLDWFARLAYQGYSGYAYAVIDLVKPGDGGNMATRPKADQQL